MLLLKGKGDDYINTLVAERLFKKVSGKIASLSESEKTRLLAALLLKEYDLPEDIKGIMTGYVDKIITETLAKETKPPMEIPESPGEVGAKVVGKTKKEEKVHEEGEEEVEKKEEKKEKAEVVRLSDL